MSLELKQAAQQTLEAIEDLQGYRPDIDRAIEALRAALSHQSDNASCKSVQRRLEVQQPVTGEPVAWLYVEDGEVMFGHPNGYRPADARPLVFGDTHPAPSVPDDVVRDAERYRFIRDADVSDDLIPDIALYAMESLDEYIDAAMLAASNPPAKRAA